MTRRPFEIVSALSVAFLSLFFTMTPAAAVSQMGAIAAVPAVSLMSAGFLPNLGQFSAPEVRFQAALPRATVFVTESDITYALFEPSNTDEKAAESRKGWVVKERPVGGTAFALKPLETAETAVSFFKGRPENWLVNLPAHKRLYLVETVPGIRVELALRNGRVEMKGIRLC
jgi:hypothetical protein